MNIEPDIFDYLETTLLEPHDDYTSEISYKDQKIIWNRLKTQQNEIERLNNIINELYSDLKTLWIVLWNMDTEMTGYQNEIFDKYYDEFHKEELKESDNNENKI